MNKQSLLLSAFLCIILFPQVSRAQDINLHFAPAVNYAVGTRPCNTIIGDFNGDGTLDLAVGNYAYHAPSGPNPGAGVSLLLNNGDGTFAPAINRDLINSAVFLSAGDFNMDGKLDLAVAILFTDKIAILLGNGDGTFQSEVYYTVGGYPRSVATADFNGDGILDLAVANSWDANVSVLLGNGDGTFGQSAYYPAGVNPWDVSISDLNGDGILDLAIVDCAPNNYQEHGNISVLQGNGDGTFASAVYYESGNSPNSLAIADFNKDGIPDIVTANSGDGTVSALLGIGNGTFAPAVNYSIGGSPSTIKASDLDGDGQLDIVTVNTATVNVLLGKGDGTFAVAFNYPAGSFPTGVAIADLNCDGKPDLAVNNYYGFNVSVLLNTSDITPPLTTALLAGTLGMNGWYISDVQVAFTATDGDGRGVAMTEYSMNNGLNWNTYSNAFTISAENTTTVIYRSIDIAGNVEQSKTVLINIDKSIPLITNVTASLYEIWPPNNKLVNVALQVVASDDTILTSKIIAVSSNESIQDIGDGNTSPDWIIIGDLSVNLRAERFGNGNGRIYTITVECMDIAGNTSTHSVNVTVAHDQRK